MLKPIDELKARIGSSSAIPDPTSIQVAGDWYYLDHISSSLAAFDMGLKKYVPMIAEKWSSQADGSHVFAIKQTARFHDGTPITAKDVIWSIKRHLIKKSATHFRLWDYIKGCENLKTLDDECEGLQAVSEREVRFKLNHEVESFYLQMASPETGIFWSGDINPKNAILTPTKFSGPYFVDKLDEKSALLKRNPYSPLSEQFPDSPRSIRLVALPISQMDDAIKSKDVDLIIRSYRPMGDFDWQKAGFGVTETANSSIIYLYGTGTGKRKPIARKFLESLWMLNRDTKINPAATFLPFSGKGTLTRDEVLSELPEHGAKVIRVLNKQNAFSVDFLEMIKQAARASGTEIEYTNASADEWNAAFDDPKAAEKYDYISSLYVASERYPTVQLRYIAGNLVAPPIDLNPFESPESGPGRDEALRAFQKWLVASGQVVPLFFNRTLFIYQSNLDLGDQSSTDGEIELWRVRQRSI